MLRLRHSFDALRRLLDEKTAARCALAVLLALHTGLLAYSAWVHSPTINEPGHLVAGISHWKFGRFELYRVNPPLVRMVAALPVMAVGYEEDWSGFYEGRGARPVFAMGADFVSANGPRTNFLVTIARWACIPFSWLGAAVCYLWARDLYGRTAGVLACALWCFEPNILGHAALMTPDAHAAALGMAACYTFWRWLRNPTWGQTVVTGVVLGLAELAKTTLILLYPVWPLLWLVDRLRERQAMNRRRWIREGGMLAVRMGIGLYVLNLGYGFEGSFTRLGDFEFVSAAFTGQRDDGESASARARAQAPTNRFAEGALAGLRVPVPRNYLLGMDIQQRDFEHYGRPSYLLGQWQEQGWWYYYLYAGLVKVPLGLFGLAACSLFARTRSAPRSFRLRDELVLLAPAVVVLAVVSAKSGFGEHFRYALPAFPFLLVWTAGLAAGGTLPQATRGKCTSTVPPALQSRRFMFPPGVLGQAAASGLLVWFLASSLSIYPHSLSYFNELAGGPLRGYRHLLGSNLDWGQDVLYAEQALAGRFAGRGVLVTPGSLYRVGDLLSVAQVESVQRRLRTEEIVDLLAGRADLANDVAEGAWAAMAVSVQSLVHSAADPQATERVMSWANAAPHERRVGYATVLVPLGADR